MAKKENFAVIKLNNTQYKVSEGDTLDVNKIAGEAGDIITFDEVLLKSTDTKVEVGKPIVEKSSVTAEIVEQTKGKKVEISTFKSKSRYRRKKGHRQQITRLKITKIS